MRRALALAVAVACTGVLALGADDAGAAGYTIRTVAGTGSSGSSGDGGKAVNATLNHPQAMAIIDDPDVAGDRSLLIGERHGYRIRRMWPDGTITLVATIGGQLTGLAVAPDGKTIYYTAYAGRQVFRIEPGGAVVPVAGTGATGFDITTGVADTSVMTPYGLATNADGDLLISLYEQNRVLKIEAGANKLADPSDPISVVAGAAGASNNAGEGTDAVTSGIRGPTGMYVNGGGDLLIASFDGHVIRRVDAAGKISTFAGSLAGAACGGPTLLCGDGRSRTDALFKQPVGITGDGVGGYLVAEYGTDRVRRIDANGIVSTFAGTGVACSPTTSICGDGGPPANASFALVWGVLLDPVSGTVYVADGGAHRVRAITPNPVVQGDPGDPALDGEEGAPGLNGVNGANGSNGANGANGPNGPNGANGANGLNGANGADGPSGSDGAPGKDGQDGADGFSGLRLPLMAVLPASRVSRSHRSAVRLSAFVVGPARLRLTASRSGRRVRSVARNVKASGRVKLSLGRLKRGRYRVTLTATRGKTVVFDRMELVVR